MLLHIIFHPRTLNWGLHWEDLLPVKNAPGHYAATGPPIYVQLPLSDPVCPKSVLSAVLQGVIRPALSWHLPWGQSPGPGPGLQEQPSNQCPGAQGQSLA